MMPVIAIRPQPGCDATVHSARALGLEAHGFPLFAIAPCAWDPPDPARIDALLIGSANALRHAGPGLAAFAGKPAYAVGGKTAKAARAAGLDVTLTGTGGLQPLLDRIDPAHRRLLRLCGRERVRLAAVPGVTIDERIVYASEPLPMPDALAELLRRRAVVLLHSAVAARHFAAEADRAGVKRSAIRLAALGPRIAVAAGSGWAMLESAAQPDDKALLALAARMCQG